MATRASPPIDEPRALLRRLFDAAISAADPAICVPPALPPAPTGRTVVVGAGKAAAAMAAAVERHWRGALDGLVVTVPGAEVACVRIEVLTDGHPVPTVAGVTAAGRVLEAVSGLGSDDLALVLLSGGGSALLALPADGLALQQKQALTRALLRSGATIREINCVRRHLSRVKGGRLAAACGAARVVTLAISDVPGDDPLDIASGPTSGDSTTCADALAILERHRVEVPSTVRAALAQGRWESVKPGSVALARAETRLVATPARALAAAAAVARAAGLDAEVTSDRVEGEARLVGATMAAQALVAAAGRAPHDRPRVLLSGGETTVTVRGAGRGGRNVEWLLAFGLALGRGHSIHALACDTDGVDGTEPVAGAVWTPDTLDRAAALGLDPSAHLDANDAHAFFGALGDSVVTGPTRTNVNDFRAIWLG